MLINTFQGKQDHTVFTKVYKLYNRIITRVLTNNGRFRVVWRSQKRSSLTERPVEIASDMQKDLAAIKTHFHSHYIFNAF